MTESKDNLNLIEKITFSLGLTTSAVVQYFQASGKEVQEKSPEEVIKELNKNRKE